ncbi:hypothetical protein G4228_001407 [Cervus hanglu yarkandensis]|nr:hypothetical protein G4228_001407 [Cervus hanglu yarkandensis]
MGAFLLAYSGNRRSGAWSPSQLLETPAQASHEFEDSWILERKAALAGVCLCTCHDTPK